MNASGPAPAPGVAGRPRWAGAVVACASACLALSAGPAPGPDPGPDVTNELRSRIEMLRETGVLVVRDAELASRIVLPDFYERRGFRLAWTDPDNVAVLEAQIHESEADGLTPSDYHLVPLGDLVQAVALSPLERVDRDLLLTDAFLRLAYDLYFGKVDAASLDPHWNFFRDLGDVDPVQTLQQALDNRTLGEVFQRVRPAQPVYRRMREELARHRGILASGGWPVVPDGPTLDPGSVDDRVVPLRRRLAASGDLGSSDNPESRLFDETVAGAVRRFQARHGLEADGRVGPATLAALNVPVEQRIDQIRVNLERARWLLHDLGGTFVIVNIAGFKLYFASEGRLTWQTRVQVGTPYRKTPVFRAEMTYLVFNPDWTVPPTIFAQDILPALRRDPGYLTRRGMRVVDARGRAVEASTIDWNRVSAKDFPYYIRQDPSDSNALGRVKFMFPNPYSVFLHDTPSKRLFDRPDRAFSSGCIRVEDPLELARLVLDDDASWNAEAIRRVVDAGALRSVSLTRPVPVLLFYWTAATEPDGELHFYRDIYGRDAPILKALAAPVRLRPSVLGTRGQAS